MALILLADDDEMVHDVVRATLSKEGHVVGAVSDGIQAVAAFQVKAYDLVILDCAMPQMTGIEALRQIRLSPGGSRVPVLMLTARRSSMDEEIASRAGATDYLRKPFNPMQLQVRTQLLLARACWEKASAGH